jgi:hypothetical protein
LQKKEVLNLSSIFSSVVKSESKNKGSVKKENGKNILAQGQSMQGGANSLILFTRETSGVINNPVNCPDGWTDVFKGFYGYGPLFLGVFAYDWTNGGIDEGWGPGWVYPNNPPEPQPQEDPPPPPEGTPPIPGPGDDIDGNIPPGRFRGPSGGGTKPDDPPNDPPPPPEPGGPITPGGGPPIPLIEDSDGNPLPRTPEERHPPHDPDFPVPPAPDLGNPFSGFGKVKHKKIFTGISSSLINEAKAQAQLPLTYTYYLSDVAITGASVCSYDYDAVVDQHLTYQNFSIDEASTSLMASACDGYECNRCKICVK